MIPSSEVSSAYSSDTDEPEELERIGNINWCNCFAMETNTESLCCHDKNEVPDVLFEGMFFICISVCLLLWFSKLFLFHMFLVIKITT